MSKILAADIGGTNSRFALFEWDGSSLKLFDSIWLKTHSAQSFSDLLDQLWDSEFGARPGSFDSAVFAVAGAVSEGIECKYLPNAPWGIDLRLINLEAEAYLINDFAAQAYACQTPAVSNAICIQTGKALLKGTIGVIGAGTGLGYSALVHNRNFWTALPSEGGHMVFPFLGKHEYEYAEFNRYASGRRWPEGDSVITGLGLKLLHQYLTGEDLSPGEVSKKITPDCETAKWFSRFYARVARNWALAMMTEGGLYISGGIAAKNPMLVTIPEFLQEFHNTHVYEDRLRGMSIRLNINEESGLYGAAFCAVQRIDRRSMR